MLMSREQPFFSPKKTFRIYFKFQKSLQFQQIIVVREIDAIPFYLHKKGNFQHLSNSQSDGGVLIVQFEATAACAESIVRAQSINPDTRCTKEVVSSKTKQTVGPQASEPQMSRCAKTQDYLFFKHLISGNL